MQNMQDKKYSWNYLIMINFCLMIKFYLNDLFKNIILYNINLYKYHLYKYQQFNKIII